ncbi:aspartyl protease precursor, partial [Aphelenchoides avenae]
TPSESSAPTSGGVITFGGRDSISCGDQWRQLGSLNSNNRLWNLRLAKLAVGSKALFTQGADALVAIGTPFLVVPMAYFRRIIIPFNPVYNVELNLYTVNCADVASLPGIRFSIGKDYDYTVPAEKFAVKM